MMGGRVQSLNINKFDLDADVSLNAPYCAPQ